MVWQYPLVIGLSYLLGAVPSGLLVGKLLRGIDIRAYGSGKTGFTNSIRSLGFAPSLLVLFADSMKGFVPMILTWAIFDSPDLQVVAGLSALIGHIWPAFAEFRGGRGVATTYGAFLGMNAPLTLILVAFAFGIIYLFRYMSLMSVVTIPIGALAFLVLAMSGLVPYTYVAFGAFASAIVIFQHRDNIRRLLDGTEPKIGQGSRRQLADS